MAKQLGNDFLMKIDIAGTKTTVGVMRAKSIKIDTESVDVTNDGSGRWRELLSGAGVRSMTVSGNGIFDDTASQNAVLTNKLAGTQVAWEIIVPQLGTFTAPFHIASLEFAGDANKEVTFSLTLESAGAIVYVAA